MWASFLAANRQKINTINEPSLVPSATVGTAKPQVKQQVVEAKKPVTDSTLPEWKRRMIEKNEAAKKEVTDIMDDSLKRVMAKAEMKPEDQRAQAVDSYVSAVDWIMWSVNTVINRVR